MTKICNESPVECGDPACPCHEWSAKSPPDAPLPENWQMKSLAPEPKDALQVKYGAGIAISAPDFEQEWESAPPSRKRYTEQAEAEHWFQRGLWLGIQYERERGLLAMNGDLKEMQRLARERVER